MAQEQNHPDPAHDQRRQPPGRVAPFIVLRSRYLARNAARKAVVHDGHPEPVEGEAVSDCRPGRVDVVEDRKREAGVLPPPPPFEERVSEVERGQEERADRGGAREPGPGRTEEPRRRSGEAGQEEEEAAQRSTRREAGQAPAAKGAGQAEPACDPDRGTDGQRQRSSPRPRERPGRDRAGGRDERGRRQTVNRLRARQEEPSGKDGCSRKGRGDQSAT